jgi:hypothetical protein
VINNRSTWHRSDDEEHGAEAKDTPTNIALGGTGMDAKGTPPRTPIGSPPGSATGNRLMSRYARRRLTKTNLFATEGDDTFPMATAGTGTGTGMTPSAPMTPAASHFFPHSSQSNSTASIHTAGDAAAAAAASSAGAPPSTPGHARGSSHDMPSSGTPGGSNPARASGHFHGGMLHGGHSSLAHHGHVAPPAATHHFPASTPSSSSLHGHNDSPVLAHKIPVGASPTLTTIPASPIPPSLDLLTPAALIQQTTASDIDITETPAPSIPTQHGQQQQQHTTSNGSGPSTAPFSSVGNDIV